MYNFSSGWAQTSVLNKFILYMDLFLDKILCFWFLHTCINLTFTSFSALYFWCTSEFKSLPCWKCSYCKSMFFSSVQHTTTNYHHTSFYMSIVYVWLWPVFLHLLSLKLKSKVPWLSDHRLTTLVLVLLLVTWYWMLSQLYLLHIVWASTVAVSRTCTDHAQNANDLGV